MGLTLIIESVRRLTGRENMPGRKNCYWRNAALSRHGQREQKRKRGHRKESDDVVCGGVVQLVRTPACHAGGHGFSSVAPSNLSGQLAHPRHR
jgi:hypothetical protein